MDSRLERQARNEALIREVNERIERVAEEARLGGEPERFEFLCECGAGGDKDIACAGHRFEVVDKKPTGEPFVVDDPRGAPST